MADQLSPAQSKVLALATTDWREIPKKVDRMLLSTLVVRRAVETRVRDTGERGQLMVAEWRRVSKERA